MPTTPAPPKAPRPRSGGSPRPPKADGGHGLKAKLGPLPLWAWIVGGVFAYEVLVKGALLGGSSAAATVPSGGATSSQPAPYYTGSGSGGGAAAPAGGGLPTTGGSSPAPITSSGLAADPIYNPSPSLTAPPPTTGPGPVPAPTAPTTTTPGVQAPAPSASAPATAPVVSAVPVSSLSQAAQAAQQQAAFNRQLSAERSALSAQGTPAPASAIAAAQNMYRVSSEIASPAQASYASQATAPSGYSLLSNPAAAAVAPGGAYYEPTSGVVTPYVPGVSSLQGGTPLFTPTASASAISAAYADSVAHQPAPRPAAQRAAPRKPAPKPSRTTLLHARPAGG